MGIESDVNMMTTNKINSLSDDRQTLDNSNYDIRPNLKNTFKSNAVKEIIQNVLQETLGGKTYTSADSSIWTTTIADLTSTRIKELCMKRFKHIVQVTIGQQTGAGCRYMTRCKWDAECDSLISDYFTNETIFCVVVVFGVYLY